MKIGFAVLLLLGAAIAVRLPGAPYVNQRWDTGDSFSGRWACGPTSAVMAMAYLGKLKPKPILTSSPSRHYNDYGYYVSNIYTSSTGTKFNAGKRDPNGRMAYGAWGTCTDGNQAWAWRIQNYITGHGIRSKFFSQATPTIIRNAINAGHPVILSTQINGVGHLMLVMGIEGSSLIVNDPWGNANLRNWGSGAAANGKYVTYTWAKARPKWMVEVLAKKPGVRVLSPTPTSTPIPAGCYGAYRVSNASAEALVLRACAGITCENVTDLTVGQEVFDIKGVLTSADGYQWMNIQYLDVVGYIPNTYLEYFGVCPVKIGRASICGDSECIQCISRNTPFIQAAMNKTEDCDTWEDDVREWCSIDQYGDIQMRAECLQSKKTVCATQCEDFCLGCGENETCDEFGNCVPIEEEESDLSSAPILVTTFITLAALMMQ